MPYSPNEDTIIPIKHIVQTRAANAVILNQTEAINKRVSYLRDNDFAIVKHGRSSWSSMHNYHDFHNYIFAHHSVDLLASCGRKNMLELIPPEDQNYDQDLMRATEESYDKLGNLLSYVRAATSYYDSDQIF